MWSEDGEIVGGYASMLSFGSQEVVLLKKERADSFNRPEQAR